jgi:hypothetical protein
MWTKTVLTALAIGLACRVFKLPPLFPPDFLSIVGIFALWFGYYGLPRLFERITILFR